MIYIPDTHAQKINSPVRRILAKVELLNSSSTNVNTFKYNDSLVSFSIDRVGEEGKFFGFGICQKINVKLRDVKRVLNITTDNYMKISLTALLTSDSVAISHRGWKLVTPIVLVLRSIDIVEILGTELLIKSIQ